MKACKFCGTQIQNTARCCPSCGAHELLRVCDNCGNLFDGVYCPSCGVKAGQKEKTCPECGTTYFTNACPNCGYTPSRKQQEQTVVHHVYQTHPAPARPAAASRTASAPRRKTSAKEKKGCGTYLLYFFLLCLIVSGVRSCSPSGSRSSSSSRSSSRSAVTSTTSALTSAPSSTPDPAVASIQAALDAALASSGEAGSSASISVHYAPEKSGRGRADKTGTEPDYIGVLGYAAVHSIQNLRTDSSYAKTPWQIPIYQKDKQFYQQTGTIDHKTQVVVIAQDLEYQGRSSYSATFYKGFLLVFILDDSSFAYIDGRNFVTSPYWESALLADAAAAGYCIARFTQKSNFYPVTPHYEKYEIADETLVLIPVVSDVMGSYPDKENNPIGGYLVSRSGNKDEMDLAFFNPSDLSIVY